VEVVWFIGNIIIQTRKQKGIKMEHTLFGKNIKDCTKEELLMAIESVLDGNYNFAIYQDEELKKENKKLKEENEKLWKCMGAKK
jgi:hypothetical protein